VALTLSGGAYNYQKLYDIHKYMILSV